MHEIIYILTMAFGVYVIYAAEGDAIVAFIHKMTCIDLSKPHNCCMNAIERFRKLQILQWRPKF